MSQWGSVRLTALTVLCASFLACTSYASSINTYGRTSDDASSSPNLLAASLEAPANIAFDTASRATGSDTSAFRTTEIRRKNASAQDRLWTYSDVDGCTYVDGMVVGVCDGPTEISEASWSAISRAFAFGNSSLVPVLVSYSPAFSIQGAKGNLGPLGKTTSTQALQVVALKPAAVPEPASLWLTASGALALAGTLRRKLLRV